MGFLGGAVSLKNISAPNHESIAGEAFGIPREQGHAPASSPKLPKLLNLLKLTKIQQMITLPRKLD